MLLIKGELHNQFTHCLPKIDIWDWVEIIGNCPEQGTIARVIDLRNDQSEVELSADGWTVPKIFDRNLINPTLKAWQHGRAKFLESCKQQNQQRLRQHRINTIVPQDQMSLF